MRWEVEFHKDFDPEFMPITLKDKMKELSPAQRKKVEARAAELIAEEMTLRELRHARKITQVKWPGRSGSLRTVFRASKSGAISCCPRSEKRSRPWAGLFRWSPSFPTVRRWFCPALPKMIRGQSRQAADV
jgi:hypothetical protein